MCGIIGYSGASRCVFYIRLREFRKVLALLFFCEGYWELDLLSELEKPKVQSSCGVCRPFFMVYLKVGIVFLAYEQLPIVNCFRLIGIEYKTICIDYEIYRNFFRTRTV